ncbi:MAG: hypothetical protein RL398_1658 [Planctomycetota bacterium]
MTVGPATATPRQHLAALLLALVAALLFLRDGLLPDSAIVPYPREQLDVYRAEALADGTFDADAARAGSTAGGDKYLQSLCWDRVLHDRMRAGASPRWTRDIGGGAPFVPQMAQVYEPINLLLLALPSWNWYGPWFLLHQVLFGWFAYVFLRRLGLLHGAGLVGVLAASLGLWTQCKLHHNVILTAALSLWPMLTAVQALVAERARGPAAARWVGWLGVWTGLSWLSGFAVVSLQVSYLVVGFAALQALRAVRGQRLRPLLLVATGLALGGLLSVAHMLPVLMASADTARDTAYNPAFLAANGLEPAHLLTALWPDLLAWPSDAFYADPAQPWRDVTRMPWSQIVLLDDPLHPITGGPFQSWVETSFAVGVIPTACAAAALARRETRAIAACCAAAALLALGFANADQPFLSLARFVPGLAAADLRRLLFVVAVSLVVLAGLGADALLRDRGRLPAAVVLGLALLGSLTLLVWLYAHADEPSFVRGTAERFVADADHPTVRAIGGNVDAAVQFVRSRSADGEWAVNHQRLLAGAWRTLLAAAIGVVVLLVRHAPLRLALALLTTGAELLHAGSGFFVAAPAGEIAAPPRTVAPALAYREPGDVRGRFQRLLAPGDARAVGIYPPNLAGSHGLEDAAGYNPLPPRRYEEFFLALEPDRAGKASVVFGGAGVGGFHDPASLRHPLADLYGIRFVLTDLPQPTDQTLRDVTPPGSGRLKLYERTTTLPRATFVREVDVFEDRAARLAALADPARDVRTRIVLERADAPRPQPSAAATATATVVRHADEEVVVRVVAAADGYLRLHDPFDPGWTATVDGKATTVYAADHYLRAVYVNAGEHEVVFRYDAPRVVWPERVSLLALAVLLALLCRRSRLR